MPPVLVSASREPHLPPGASSLCPACGLPLLGRTPSFCRAPAGQGWALCSVLQGRGERSPFCRPAGVSRRALEEGNPSCGLPDIPCGSSSPAKTKPTFSLFFFNSLLSLRPNRRRGSPTGLSQAHAGWKPASLSLFPTPFPAASPAAPSLQQHPGEQGAQSNAMGRCRGARARSDHIGTDCLPLAHVNQRCSERSWRRAADLRQRGAEASIFIEL